MAGRVTGGADVSRREFRLASATTATVLGGLSLLSLPASLAITAANHQLPASSSDVANTAAWVAFVLAFTTVGVVVARREPRNPMGWLLIGVALAVEAGNDGSAYAYLDYTLHHGALPLGQVAVLLSASWEYAFVMLPLVIVLFPDGRLGPHWRWPVRAYLAVAVVVVAGTLSVAVAAFGLRTPVDSSGNLVGLNHPSGANAWFRPVQSVALVACLGFVLAAVVYQVRRYRRASGEPRQQLKWLAAGAFVCIACIVINNAAGGGSGVLGGVTFSIGLAALPLGMGVGILKYRLYEIDRLISRTLSYTLVTGLLVGVFFSLVILTTRVLPLSSPVGVAASTFAAAAIFNPLRRRVQHLVDRRFNRARYNAEETLSAFTVRLRDAVDLDTIQTDLVNAVNRAVQPTHASVWIRPRA